MERETQGKDFPGQFFEQSSKALLCLLLLAILGGIAAGIGQSFWDLWDCFLSISHTGESEGNYKHLLIDILNVLVLVEVFRTAMAYFTEGRVKVTYIIDTVLVAVLTEVLAFWHKEVEADRLVMVIALVLVLMLVRLLAIRYSPKRMKLFDGL